MECTAAAVLSVLVRHRTTAPTAPQCNYALKNAHGEFYEMHVGISESFSSIPNGRAL